MNTRSALLAVLLMPLAVFAAGCGPDLTEKVQGVWKVAEGQRSAFGSGEGGFIEIGKDRIIFDDDTDKVLDIVLEEKDGKVALRRAGTEDVFGVVGFVEDDMVEFSLTVPGLEKLVLGAGMKVRLLRSSKEEMNELYHPPVEKIAGLWRTEAESAAPLDSVYIEIAGDSVSVNGSKTGGTFTTKKGAYIFSSSDGGREERYFFNDGRLFRARGGLSSPQVLLPSSPEEMAAAARAKQAAVEKHFGFWREARTDSFGTAIKYLELGPGNVDDNGQATPAQAVYAPGEVQWFKPGEAKPFMTTRLDEAGHLNVDLGRFSHKDYERGDREELEKMNSPRLEDFIGYWLPAELGSGSFRAVEIGADYIVSDNRREAVRVASTRTNALSLVRPLPRESFVVTLSHADNGRITMKYSDSYGDAGFRFRRVEKSEYDAVAGTLVDPRTVIPGFWRSERPVRENEVYATAVFSVGVRGEKGDIVDRGSWLLVDPRLRNLTINNRPTVREGMFVVKDGRAGNPLVLTDDPDSNRSWLQIHVGGPDELAIAVDYEKYQRFVRCTEEEVARHLERIAAMR